MKFFAAWMLTWTASAGAFVTVDTARDWATPPGLGEDIAAAIRDGVYDARAMRFAIAGEGKALPAGSVVDEAGRRFMILTARSFNALDSSAKSEVTSRLASYYSWAPSYRVTVKPAENDLAHEPTIQRLKLPLEQFLETVGAESLLSPYGRTWAYRLSQYDGPNCWHSSLASVHPGWEKHRYMKPEEFACHVRTTYGQVSRPTEWGDLIRLTNDAGEVHGFTFLGLERGTGRWIVFTKNGFRQSYYLFMDYQSVLGVYPGSTVTFYRAKESAIDPAADAAAPCAAYAVPNGPVRESLEDPIIVAGLRRVDTRAFAPLYVP